MELLRLGRGDVAVVAVPTPCIRGGNTLDHMDPVPDRPVVRKLSRVRSPESSHHLDGHNLGTLGERSTARTSHSSGHDPSPPRGSGPSTGRRHELGLDRFRCARTKRRRDRCFASPSDVVQKRPTEIAAHEGLPRERPTPLPIVTGCVRINEVMQEHPPSRSAASRRPTPNHG